MNKAHKLVWNDSTRSYVAVPETAKGRGKSKTLTIATLLSFPRVCFVSVENGPLKKSVGRFAMMALLVSGLFGGLSEVAFAFTPIGSGAVSGTAGNVVIGDNASASSTTNSGASYLIDPLGTILPYTYSTVIGNFATNNGYAASTVIGDHANVSGTFSIALGGNASAAQFSQAIGYGAYATGGWSTAIGQSAFATNIDTTAIGTNSRATGARATAIGSAAKATGSDSFAMGRMANAVGTGSFAIGLNAATPGNYAIVMGSEATETGDKAVAIGYQAHANAESSQAMGDGAQTNMKQALAVGSNANASGLASTALGAGAEASDTSAMALGSSAKALGVRNLAIGSNAQVQGSDSVAMGSSASANGQYAFALGTSAQAASDYGIAMGYGSQANAMRSVAIGYNAQAQSGRDVIALGTNAQVNVQSWASGIAMGANTKTQIAYGVAIGEGASVTRGATEPAGVDGGVAIGHNAHSYNTRLAETGMTTSTAVGNGADADAASVAYGEWAKAQYLYSSALGSTSTAGAEYATAVGANSVAASTNSTALGYGAKALTSNSVALGANSVADGTASDLGASGYVFPGSTVKPAGDASGEVSVGSAGQERRMTNLAAGLSDTDAVNVSQLKVTDTVVSNLSSSVATALGGGAANTDGSLTAPSYTMTNIDGSSTIVNNVGDAITNLDGRTKLNTADISTLNTHINDGTIGPVQRTGTDQLSLIASGGDATNPGAAQVLTNVANGAVTAASTDAVNGSQLLGVSQSTATALGGGAAYDTATGTLIAPTYNLHNLDGSTIAYNSVGDAITNLDGRTAQNTTDITNLALNGSKYFHANSSLNDSQAVGQDSIAIGPQAYASSTNGIAMGKNAQSLPGNWGLGDNIAIGSNTLNHGNGAVVIGNSASAGTVADWNSWGGAVAIGSGAQLRNGGQLALGGNSSAQTTGAIALGFGAEATGWFSTAMQSNSHATGANSVAIGTGASAGEESVAIGGNGHTDDIWYDGAQAMGARSVAIGSQSGATGAGSLALGSGAQASASNSVALGADSTTTANLAAAAFKPGTTALAGETAAGEVSIGSAGNERRLTNVAAGSAGTDAVNVSQLRGVSQVMADALGGGSTVNTDGSFVAPTYNVTNADGSTTTIHNVGDAITNLDGRTTQNTTDITNLNTQINNGEIGLVQQEATTRTITVAKDKDGKRVDFTGTEGARVLTGVDAGAVNAASVEAVNGSQLYGVSKSAADAMGGGSTVNVDGSISAPTYTVTNIDGSTRVFHNVGDTITNIDNRIVQNSTDITNLNTIINSGGAGMFRVSADYAGPAPAATGAKSVAAGANAVATEERSMAVGNDTQATASNSTSIGMGAVSSATNSVALGADSVANRANTVSVGSEGNERQIVNVAAGTRGTDAVNLSQLAAATGITVHDDGSINTPTYSITHVSYGGTTINNFSNAADAITDLNTAVNQGSTGMFQVSQDYNQAAPKPTGKKSTAGGANAVASGNNSTAMGADSKATANNSVALGASSVADRDSTVSVGSAGNERQITNVANGVEATDAVNVSQLSSVGDQAIGQANAYTDYRVDKVNRDASAGTAAAMAMAGLPQSNIAGKGMVALAAGTFDGESALALGVSHASENGRWVVKASASANTRSKYGASVGAGFHW